MISDSTLREIFDDYVKLNSIYNLFQIFCNKFERKSPKDDFKSFLQIFNFFVYFICEYYSSIDSKISIEIYETIMKFNTIAIKNDLIEKFILKVVSSYSDNFLLIENVLLVTGTQLNARMVEKIFDHFSKVKYHLFRSMMYSLH